MQRIQTGGHLHRLTLVYRLTGGIERTSEIKWGTTIGVVILDDEILNLLSIHEWGRKGMFLCLDIVVILETISSQELLYLLVWTRGDLVDHRPWEGDLLLILQISEECLRNETVLHPALCIGEDTSLNLVTIVRTVVHALNGQRQLACVETLEEQRTNLTHREQRTHATCKVCLIISVAFLCDGERDHLKRRILEDLHQTVPVRELWISLQRLSNRSNHLLLDRSVRTEIDAQ